jgi:hypothetical protein
MKKTPAATRIRRQPLDGRRVRLAAISAGSTVGARTCQAASVSTTDAPDSHGRLGKAIWRADLPGDVGPQGLVGPCFLDSPGRKLAIATLRIVGCQYPGEAIQQYGSQVHALGEQSREDES